MKKAVAFLLAFLIFVAPMTTFVKADVVIGDNDNTIVNENATILGRKLAMLESLSDLALSGVTEFTISNTEDVDSYLDSLWSEINDAIDYLDSGDWVSDIPSNIASKYYTNLVKYRDIVNNRGEFLGFDLQNPTTSLLKTYFANDIYGKKYTSTGLYQSLDMFRALSGLSRGGNTPNPNPDYNSYIYTINSENPTFPFKTNGIYNNSSNQWPYWIPGGKVIDSSLYSFVWNGQTNIASNGMNYNSQTTSNVFGITDILDVYINSIDNNTYYYSVTPIKKSYASTDNGATLAYGLRYSSSQGSYYITNFISNFNLPTISYSGTLEQVFQHLTLYFRNINIYVNGDPWSIVGTSQSPTLDIDGIIKIYGNDYPRQYELQPNTQIDYDQLYQVIYNAIRDNLPISQGDINYYDSHDTIYSPTIINNYGDDEGEESDLIDTILDYAVIPKFDTSIAQPMRSALTNGVVIMQNSITNVIPNEILLILGACFFLLLFAVVINRMIK